jgi:hypothetical protein
MHSANVNNVFQERSTNHNFPRLLQFTQPHDFRLTQSLKYK